MLAVAMLPDEPVPLSGLAPVWSPDRDRSGPQQEKTFFARSRKTRDRRPHHNIQGVIAAKYPQRKSLEFLYRHTPHATGWLVRRKGRKIWLPGGIFLWKMAYFMDKVLVF